jgi:succinyl-CoA synthetase alpha subunit
MSIFIDKNTRLLVQGVTGHEGLFHTQQMLAYGTKVVAGVTPGKGGEWVESKIPVFDTVKTAVEATGANVSVIFVPARFAPDAMLEAADAGIPLVICITEGIPVQDMMRVRSYLDQKKVRLSVLIVLVFLRLVKQRQVSSPIISLFQAILEF